MQNNTIQTLRISCLFVLLLLAGIVAGCNKPGKRGAVPTGDKPIPHQFVTECNAVFNELSLCLQIIDISYYQGNEAIKQEIDSCEQTANPKLQQARRFLTKAQDAKKAVEFERSAAVTRPAIKECVQRHLLFSRPAAISCIIQRYQTWQRNICTL